MLHVVITIMPHIFSVFAFIVGLAASLNAYASGVDTVVRHTGNVTHYGHRSVRNELSKSRKLWGNSTFLAAGYNYSGVSQAGFEVGRTYVTVHESMLMRTGTIGMGASHLYDDAPGNYYKLFCERTFCIPPVLGVCGRAEVITDQFFSAVYLSPAAGIVIAPMASLHFDIQYAHAFQVAGAADNPFKNLLVLRCKVHTSQDRWQSSWHTHH